MKVIQQHKITHLLASHGELFVWYCKLTKLVVDNDKLFVYNVYSSKQTALSPPKQKASSMLERSQMEKFCCRCKNDLDASLFNRRSRSSDGLDTYCRECANAYVKDWKARRLATNGTSVSRKTWVGGFFVKDFTGQKFGSFTVISPVGKRSGQVIWNCICDCGGESILSANHLRDKASQKGCCKCRTPKRIAVEKYSNAHTTVSRYITGAKVRGLDWQLSLDEALSFLEGDCFYCGAKPSLVTAYSKGEEFVFNGIDRLDNAQGYSPDNCVTCCTRCNCMKSRMHVDDFVSKISQIYHHLQSKK